MIKLNKNKCTEVFIAKKWSALEKASSPEIVASVKELYKIFGDGVVEWLAELYEPSAGGFYYSNSARDGYGFAPDIESTLQATGYIAASGMLIETGESLYFDFIPTSMRESIIKFIKNLQDPNDGYFYHPQWGKGISSSRRSRDLMWATCLLKNFGSAPTYDAPDGTKGDGILADGSSVPFFADFRENFGSKYLLAASKILKMNEIDPRLENAETFLCYLEEKFGDNGNFPMRKYSAQVAGELTALGPVIVERDKQLVVEKKPTITPMLINWINERQNEYGHWQYETDEEGNLLTDSLGNYIPLTNYNASNAIPKIVTLYETLGYKMPNTEFAAKTAIDAITSDEPLSGISDIYDTWFALNCIRRNLINFGGEDGKTEYETLREKLLKIAPKAILATKEKLEKFRKSDDSFAYTKNGPSSTSQNAPVSVPGTNEGDINATRIAVNTVKDLYGALGISEYFVPIYTKEHAACYKKMLENRII